MTKTKRRNKGKIKKKRSIKRKSSGAGTMGSSNSPRFSFARHQKGGVLFKIQDRDLEELQHIGRKGTVGEKGSCVACSMHQLRFPIDLVNEATRLANLRNAEGGARGVYMIEAKQLINDMLRKHNLPQVQMWSWAVLKDSDPKTLSVNLADDSGNLGENQENIQSINMTRTALEGIFRTLEPGTATLFMNRYQQPGWEEVFAHAAVIAKSYHGTPYLIETQKNPYQGLYRGMDDIMDNYYAKQMQVGSFLTYSSSEPINKGGIWKVENEPVLDLKPEESRPEGLEPENVQTISPARLASFAVQARQDEARRRAEEAWRSPAWQAEAAAMANRAEEARRKQLAEAEEVAHRAAEMRAAELRETDERARDIHLQLEKEQNEPSHAIDWENLIKIASNILANILYDNKADISRHLTQYEMNLLDVELTDEIKNIIVKTWLWGQLPQLKKELTDKLAKIVEDSILYAPE